MAKSKPNRRSTHLSADAIAEDLFGLNFRGLQSILTLWWRPKRYFDAAKTPDWENKYTPSIRLWLSFFALFSALKFWWIGGNAGMIGAFATGFADAGLTLPHGMTYDDVGKEAVLWIFGLVPFLQVASMAVLSLIFNAWGERTTITLRQRYLFSIIIPSASLMPILLTIMVIVPQNLMSVYGVFLAVASLLIDWQVGYRGAFSEVSKIGRLWRSGLLAFIIVALNTMTAIMAQIAGIIVISQKYGVTISG